MEKEILSSTTSECELEHAQRTGRSCGSSKTFLTQLPGLADRDTPRRDAAGTPNRGTAGLWEDNASTR